MRRELAPKQPTEVLTMFDHAMFNATNRLLKPHGIVLKKRGSYAQLGDQVYLRVEKIT